jgi:tRNA(Ile)-lysidine synthase
MLIALASFLKHYLPLYPLENSVAVGVSGGPDSMALAGVLEDYRRTQGGPNLVALTVDHGLRAESAAEARQAGIWLGDAGIPHHVLRWEGAKPDSAVQEAARTERYRLMTEYCRSAGIRLLFLAHHQDDQAETVLLRLAAGSGLDGLAGMSPLQALGDIVLARPFLGVSKAELTDYCHRRGLPFVVDPSNASEHYARVRMRKSRTVLEREGLSAKRLALTAKRLARARQALEGGAQAAYEKGLVFKDTDRFVFKKSFIVTCYNEIVFRVFKLALSGFSGGEESSASYGPRTERIESMVEDFLKSEPFRKRTLGGVVISVDDKKDEIVFEKESGKKR